MGLTLPTHLQVLQVPGPGEQAAAAVPVLLQERVFLESKGKVGSQREGRRGPSGRPEDGQQQRREVQFSKDGRGSSGAGQGIAHCGEGGGQPRGGGQTRLQPRWSRSPQEGAGGSPTAGGVGRLTKASLAVLKACSS